MVINIPCDWGEVCSLDHSLQMTLGTPPASLCLDVGPATYLSHGLPHVLQVLGELRDCQHQRVQLFCCQNPVLGQDFLKEWLKKDPLTDATGNNESD